MFTLHLPLHQTALLPLLLLLLLLLRLLLLPLLLLLLLLLQVLLAVADVISFTSCSVVDEHMSFKQQCCSHHVWVSLCQATHSICIMLCTMHLLVRCHSTIWYELEHCNASNKCSATNVVSCN